MNQPDTTPGTPLGTTPDTRPEAAPGGSAAPDIPASIFNIHKSDYKSTALFLGQPGGLLDSIHRPHPELFAMYKKMLSLRWDENEFDYASCNSEFKTCSRGMYDAMIYNLAYQWEADTVASKSIVPLLAPFITNSELWGATLAIGTNEYLHGLTYSEIVRNSFDNPDEVLGEILDITESFHRLQAMAKVFGQVHDVSHRYALGHASDDEAYNAVMAFYVALYCLERIQFISSFIVTFAFGEIGMFVPIAKAIQKICQDEFEVHQRLDRMVIQIELATPRGQQWLAQNRERVHAIVTEITQAELNWSEFLGSQDRELPGITVQKLQDSVIYNAQPVYEALGLPSPFRRIEANPLPFVEEWMNVNAIQAAPQEEAGRNSAYLIGNIVPRDKDKLYSTEGL